MCNNSLKQLYEDLQRRFSIKYLLTYRLNQDVLENFFGVIRAKGGLHDHPTPLEFKYRLRSYILGRNEGSYSICNVEIDDTLICHCNLRLILAVAACLKSMLIYQLPPKLMICNLLRNLMI